MHHAVSRSTRRPPAALAVLHAALLAAACQAGPVAWEEGERSEPLPPPSAATGPAAPEAVADSLLRGAVAARLACEGAGGATAASCAGAVPPAIEAAAVPGGGAACPGSLRLAAGKGDARAAVWWAPRPDRSAWLLAARSTDGGRTWGEPLPVDTLDRSTAGCDRPAPSVALDARYGFLHVAYSLVAPEGEGIFYAHQMNPAEKFEQPLVIVYGERPAATSVASDGDLVAVAYEDPNTRGRPFVSLALSRTAGHSFDARLAVSGRSVAAVRPQVAARGSRVAVGWVERPSPRALTTFEDARTALGAQPGFLVVRAGTVR